MGFKKSFTKWFCACNWLCIALVCLFFLPSGAFTQTKEAGKKEWVDYSYKERAPALSMGWVMGADYLKADFHSFENLLGVENTELLSGMNEAAMFGLHFAYKRYFAGFRASFANQEDQNSDKVRLTCYNYRYDIFAGYNILNSRKVNFGPVTSLKWNRFRLLNSDKKYRIDFDQHINNRDLNLRFNQFTGFAGLNLGILLYDTGGILADYWILGLYGGYVFKLHDLPLMYAKRNRLLGYYPIEVSDFGFGVYFNFVFN